MASSTFEFSLITPEQLVLEAPARFVAFPAHDGEMGILPQRAPLVCKLGMGELRVQSDAGDQRYFVEGGFAQMVGDRLTILAEYATLRSDLHAADARRELAEAQALPATDEATAGARTHAVERAKLRLRLAGA